jgi:hypothetical protein
MEFSISELAAELQLDNGESVDFPLCGASRLECSSPCGCAVHAAECLISLNSDVSQVAVGARPHKGKRKAVSEPSGGENMDGYNESADYIVTPFPLSYPRGSSPAKVPAAASCDKVASCSVCAVAEAQSKEHNEAAQRARNMMPPPVAPPRPAAQGPSATCSASPSFVFDSPRVAERHRHWRAELRNELLQASLTTQTILAPCLQLNALQTALHLMRLLPTEVVMLDHPLALKVARFQESARAMRLMEMLSMLPNKTVLTDATGAINTSKLPSIEEEIDQALSRNTSEESEA